MGSIRCSSGKFVSFVSIVLLVSVVSLVSVMGVSQEAGAKSGSLSRATQVSLRELEEGVRTIFVRCEMTGVGAQFIAPAWGADTSARVP